jgi:hypothetical protein
MLAIARSLDTDLDLDKIAAQEFADFTTVNVVDFKGP